MSNDNCAVSGQPNNVIEAVGPFDVSYITINGYRVPNMEGFLHNGMWTFRLNDSYAVDVPEAYGLSVATAIAHAMAIGAGYTCFGEGSKPLNPFKRRLIGLDLVSISEGESESEGATPCPIN